MLGIVRRGTENKAEPPINLSQILCLVSQAELAELQRWWEGWSSFEAVAKEINRTDTQSRYTEPLLEQRWARETTARVYKLPGAQRKEYLLVMLHFGGTERQKAALVPSWWVTRVPLEAAGCVISDLCWLSPAWGHCWAEPLWQGQTDRGTTFWSGLPFASVPPTALMENPEQGAKLSLLLSPASGELWCKAWSPTKTGLASRQERGAGLGWWLEETRKGKNNLRGQDQD